jgi:predicted ester cyclase
MSWQARVTRLNALLISARQAFSGLQITEHEVVEDGHALVIRGQNSAVRTGVFLGIDPVGRRVS